MLRQSNETRIRSCYGLFLFQGYSGQFYSVAVIGIKLPVRWISESERIFSFSTASILNLRPLPFFTPIPSFNTTTAMATNTHLSKIAFDPSQIDTLPTIDTLMQN